MDRKKKGKYVGLAGALLVHVVVIALLILVGFTLPEQSEEGGVPVMMGEVPDAWGAADPSLVEVDVMPEETAPGNAGGGGAGHADTGGGRNSCHKA